MFDWTGQSACPQAGLLVLSLIVAGFGCNKGTSTERTDARVATWRDGGYPVPCLASCDDGNSCTVDSCDPATGQCRNDLAPDGTACDDGDPCSLGDSCTAGICYGATQKDCATPPDQCHEPGYCVSTDGTCSYPVSGDGKKCDDNNLCTSGEYCLKGECKGTSLQCSLPAICDKDGICKDHGVPAFPSPLWGLVLDGNADATYNPGLALAPSGSLFLTGGFIGTLDLGAGAMTSAGVHDAFVARLDPESGKALWSRAYGDRFEQRGITVAVNATGTVAVAGAFLGTIDLVKAKFANTTSSPMVYLAAHAEGDGTALWAKRVDLLQGGSSIADIEIHMIADPTGAFIICGLTDKAVTDLAPDAVAGGGVDAIVAKLDGQTGDVNWARQIGAAGDEQCDNLAADSEGNVYVAGHYGYGSKLDFGGGFTLAAPTSRVQVAAFVAKLDGLTGATVWARSVTAKLTGQVAPRTIVARGPSVWIGGGLFGTAVFDSTTVTAPTTLKSTAFVSEFVAADGSVAWAKGWGNTARVLGLSLTSGGDLLVAGDYGSDMSFESGKLADSPGGTQAFIAKLAAGNGGATAARGYAASVSDGSTSTALANAAGVSSSGSPDNASYLVGTFEGKFDLGPPVGALAGVGTTRVFLAKIAP